MPFAGTGGGGDVTQADLAAVKNFLTTWEGKEDPTSADLGEFDRALRRGTTTGSPYSSTNQRWGLSDGNSRTNNLVWRNDRVDWTRAAVAFTMLQTEANWATTVFLGSTTDVVVSDASIRNADAGFGIWIGRPTTSGTEGFWRSANANVDATGAWNLFVVDGQSSGTINDFTVGTVANKGTDNPAKNIARVRNQDLPSRTDATIRNFLVTIFDRELKIFMDRKHVGTWQLTAAQAAQSFGPYFGVSGDGGSIAAKRAYIYDWFVGAPSLVTAFNKFVPDGS